MKKIVNNALEDSPDSIVLAKFVVDDQIKSYKKLKQCSIPGAPAETIKSLIAEVDAIYPYDYKTQEVLVTEAVKRLRKQESAK